MSNFMEFRLVEDGRTDGKTEKQTQTTKLVVAFRNFAKAPNTPLKCSYYNTARINCQVRNVLKDEQALLALQSISSYTLRNSYMINISFLTDPNAFLLAFKSINRKIFFDMIAIIRVM